MPPRPQSLPSDAPLAPRWHTAALVALIVSVFVGGLLLGGRAPAPRPDVTAAGRIGTAYFPMAIVAWGLVFYVARVGRPRSELAALVGCRWASARRAIVDVALAIGGFVLVHALELAWLHATATGAPASVSATLPRGALDRGAWLVVAASVGFSEELVYRGYLQRQLAAFTGHATLATVLQAILFGMAHAEQGAAAAVRVGVYGLAFGGLARWRKSLVPGVLCHVAIDVASGLSS